MKRILKRLLKKEEGQAFAEYMVLFPGAIMIVIAMGFSLGEGLKYSYCEAVGMFSNGLCEIEPFQEPDGSTFCHCERGEANDLGEIQMNCNIARFNDGHLQHDFDYWSADGTCEGWHDSGQLDGSPGQQEESGPTPIPTDIPEDCQILELTGDCSQCDGDENCTCLPGINAGIYEHPGIESLVIYAGKEYHIFYTGFTDDGCYYVSIDPEMVSWEKYVNGHDCRKIDHLQAWKVVICPGPAE